MKPRKSLDQIEEPCPHGIQKRTVLIGDLHGNRDALEVTLRTLGLLDSRSSWMGRGTDVVLTGDLLADRIPQDCRVAAFICELRKKMAETGDALDLLMGNHDLEALNFILGGLGHGLTPIHQPESRGYEFLSGIRALAALGLGRKRTQGVPLADIFQARAGEGPRFLEKFCNTKRGKEVKELLVSLRPWHQKGRIWFQHTPPTGETLNLMNNPGLLGSDSIVGDFFEETVSLQDRNTWFNLMGIWVSVDNRRRAIPCDEAPAWDCAKKKGISVFAFGHDPGSSEYAIRTRSGEMFHLLGADHRFGQEMADLKDKHAVLSAISFNPDDTVTRKYTRHYG